MPGIGPVVVAGPLAAALGDLSVSDAAGRIAGALSSIGVPEEHAREYAAAVEQGRTVVSVRAPEITEELVERVLIANGGENVHCA
jgi:hypothetical protein